MDGDGKIRAWDVLGRETVLDSEKIEKTEPGIFGIKGAKCEKCRGFKIFTRRALTRDGQTYFLKGSAPDHRRPGPGDAG